MTIAIPSTYQTYYYNQDYSGSTTNGLSVQTPFNAILQKRTQYPALRFSSAVVFSDSGFFIDMAPNIFSSSNTAFNKDHPNVYAPNTIVQGSGFNGSVRYSIVKAKILGMSTRIFPIKDRFSLSPDTVTSIDSVILNLNPPADTTARFVNLHPSNLFWADKATVQSNYLDTFFCRGNSNPTFQTSIAVQFNKVSDDNFRISVENLTSNSTSSTRQRMLGMWGGRAMPTSVPPIRYIGGSIPHKVRNCDGSNNMAGFPLALAFQIDVEIQSDYNVKLSEAKPIVGNPNHTIVPVTLKFIREDSTFFFKTEFLTGQFLQSPILLTKLGNKRYRFQFNIDPLNIPRRSANPTLPAATGAYNSNAYDAYTGLSGKDGPIIVSIEYTAYDHNGLDEQTFETVLATIPVRS